MQSVYIAGLPGHFGSWLAERLPRVTVQVTFSASEAAEQAKPGSTVLLIDLAVGADDTALALRGLRSRGGRVPVIVTVDPGEKGVDERMLDTLVRDLGVERVLFHPLDRAELLRTVQQLLGADEPAQPASPPPWGSSGSGRAAP